MAWQFTYKWLAKWAFNAFFAYKSLRPYFKNQKSPTYDITLDNTASQSLPIPIVYGETRVAGNVIWAGFKRVANSVDNNYWLIGISEGEVNSITDVKVDGNQITNPASGTNFSYDTTYNIGFGRYLGTSSQNIQPFIFDSSGVVLSTFAARALEVGGLRYTAYIVINEQSRGGIITRPHITCTVQGLNIEVYSGGAWASAYSNNPAFIIRDFLTNTRYGAGLASTRINDASFITEAAYCDTLVTDQDGNSVKRFTLDIVIDQTRPVADILDDMLASFGGFLIDKDGELHLDCEKEESLVGVQAFTMSNIIADSFSWQKTNLEETPNRIKVIYTDLTAANYQNFAIAEDSADMEDRGVVEEEIRLLGITRFTQASRMAWQYLQMVRMNETACNFGVSINDMESEVGDIVTVTHTITGWSAKPFRIVSIEEMPDDNLGLTCVEYNPNIFTDDHGSILPENNYSTLTDPRAKPEALSGFTIITNYADLGDYPISLQREIKKEIIDRVTSGGGKLAPVVLTDFLNLKGNTKRIDVKSILPAEKAGTQITGTCTSDGVDTVTITGADWITDYGGSLMGQYMITFSGSDDGIEHRILSYYVDGGVDTGVVLSTENGAPQSGRFFVVSEKDIA